MVGSAPATCKVCARNVYCHAVLGERICARCYGWFRRMLVWVKEVA